MALNRKTKLKSEKFDRNIRHRGNVASSEREKNKSRYPVGPAAMALFLFIVIGSAILQIVQTFTKGTPMS